MFSQTALYTQPPFRPIDTAKTFVVFLSKMVAFSCSSYRGSEVYKQEPRTNNFEQQVAFKNKQKKENFLF